MKTIYLAVILLLIILSGLQDTRGVTIVKDKIQLVYREDVDEGVWNLYVFGTTCGNGRLILHVPTDPHIEPLRIECVIPRK